MALVENVRGHARILEAFPPVVEKLIPNVVRSDRRGPLQHYERQQWQRFIGSWFTWKFSEARNEHGSPVVQKRTPIAMFARAVAFVELVRERLAAMPPDGRG
jgi:hypothetical protein